MLFWNRKFWTVISFQASVTKQSLCGLKVNLQRGDTSLIHSDAVHKACLEKVLAAHCLSGCSTMSGSKAESTVNQSPEPFTLQM